MRRQTVRPFSDWFPALLAAALLSAGSARAQMTDTTQTPSVANEGIHKSLAEQAGPGRGDDLLPGSSLYVIHRDPFRAIRRGRQIFQRKFTLAEGAGPRSGDGVGDIAADASLGAGLADSCAGCHGRPRGAAGFGGDVFTRPDSRDAPHLFGLGLVEMVADEITRELRATRSLAIAEARATGRPATRRLIAKGIDFGALTALPNGDIDTSAVRGVNPDLRVRPFFAQGGTTSIREFVVGALNAEMGLQAVDPDLVAASGGADIVTPAGMLLSGSLDRIEAPKAQGPTDDPDRDGVVNEVPVSLVDYIEFYLLNYFRPGLSQPAEATAAGRRVFQRVGCASCHIQDLWIDRDRRVADVETAFDPARGIFNRLFATASPRLQLIQDTVGQPPLKLPSGQPFLVKDIFADFRRHDLGPTFHERNFDGSVTTLFMTEPLWGVGSTPPYGHDGRSTSLTEVILRHGGEAQTSRDRFAALPDAPRAAMLAFLESLVLFPPDDTASNLDPGNPEALGFPQKGHGSIALRALFNDPGDPE
ncbi:MAG: thiol oxidoreductase-like protein [Acidobacteria bacterium]|nr:thiol oxidoreductase-like protein [Acidobacteriota bacterium]